VPRQDVLQEKWNDLDYLISFVFQSVCPKGKATRFQLVGSWAWQKRAWPSDEMKNPCRRSSIHHHGRSPQLPTELLRLIRYQLYYNQMILVHRPEYCVTYSYSVTLPTCFRKMNGSKFDRRNRLYWGSYWFSSDLPGKFKASNKNWAVVAFLMNYSVFFLQ
jgi:hypothetical protein